MNERDMPQNIDFVSNISPLTMQKHFGLRFKTFCPRLIAQDDNLETCGTERAKAFNLYSFICFFHGNIGKISHVKFYSSAVNQAFS